MSAFFIAINRDKRPFDATVADAMMAQIDHFGNDSKRLVVQDHFAIGYQSNWTVPEEVGEKQPLQISSQHWFVFYGRIDNRQAIFKRLEQQPDADVSDADLAQQYLGQFGRSGLQDIIGPFVLFDFRADSEQLIFARDGMGGRSLSYRICDDYILAATYEMALVAHPSVEYRLNDATVALHIVNQMQNGPSSMVAGLQVLSPGHLLSIDGKGHQCDRFYSPDPKRRIVFESDDEYAAEFKRLLAQAVSRRLRCCGDIGSQLSGGMDSVPVTILAATELASKKESSEHQVLSAYSWVFDKFPEADEREYSGPVCQKYNIEQIKVNCDDLWLSYDLDANLDPLGPLYNPFMAYNHELFREAKHRSTKVMLTGIHGDILYLYTSGILYELMRAGEYRQMFAEAWVKLKSSVSLWAFVKDSLIKPIPLVNRILRWRFQRSSVADHILQPHIIDQISSQAVREAYLTEESRSALRPQQWQVVLGDFTGNDTAVGRYFEAGYGIERRYPFRDRELCEFMLAIPSRQLAFNNVVRPIVKRAFANEFPENMANRNIKAYFSQVTVQGLRTDTENITWGTFGSRDWAYYVKECYFDGKVEQNHLLEVVKWRCGYYDYWKSVCYHPLADKLGLTDDASN